MKMLDTTILNTALPAIANSLGRSPLAMHSVVISYILTVAFLIPASGWLADYFGVRKVFVAAIFVFSLGSLACALSNTVTQLVLSRILQGVGGAMMVPVGRLAVIKTVSRKELVSALSFITIPALLGPLLGPSFGGIIVQYFSWRWIFLINIPVGLACAVMSYFFMPPVAPVKNKFDWVGFLLFSTGIICLCISLGGKTGSMLSGRGALLLFLAGCALMAGYAKFSLSHPWTAIFKPRLFFERSFSVGILANLLLRFGGGAVPFLTPLLLQTAMGYPPVKSGLAMVPLGLATMVGKTSIEKMLNFFGYRKFLTFNTIIIGLMLTSFSLIGPHTPYGVILVFLGCLGFFNSMQFTALNTLTLIAVPNRDLSEANSLLTATMQVSLSTGVALAGGALAFFGAHTCELGSAKLFYSFHATYIFLGVLTAVGSLLFISPLAKGIFNKPKDAA